MFKNIGSKIKGLAVAICVMGMLASVIYATRASWMPDFLGMIVGFIISWASTFVLYGLGELIDNSKKILETLERIADDKDRF